MGSRVMQNCLLKTSKDIIIKIFNEIKDNFCDMIVNQYGNYFCQKFFSCLPLEYRTKFFENVILLLKKYSSFFINLFSSDKNIIKKRFLKI